MHSCNQLEQAWQDSALESIINIVKAPDGDFESIGKLANSLSDQHGLHKVIEFLSSIPQGKQAFQKRIRLGDVDLQKLYRLPANTLGYAYAKHMLENNLKPLQAGQVENDYQFLGVHITETHDIWHIVTGCNTDILGEIQLEAFYVAQLYFTRFWLALLAKNLVKAVIYDIEVSTKYMDAIAKGWLMGKQAKPLFGIEWNLLWEQPLENVRTSLNIILPET
ncbi:Coq4 family protein [Chlorogloeopsis sp. ULAP02]|uniref:Coq4 family protein n=1 Tax=Chlorogloeopsis sp. ULAP02 TaxID=3107926 RepID=UPI003135D4D2